MYNSIEQIALRIAGAFENRLDEERGWHAEAMRRVALDIPGVRPALLPAELAADLQDLRGFRHLIGHAYDLELRADRVSELISAAERVAAVLPCLLDRYFSAATASAV